MSPVAGQPTCLALIKSKGPSARPLPDGRRAIFRRVTTCLHLRRDRGRSSPSSIPTIIQRHLGPWVYRAEFTLGMANFTNNQDGQTSNFPAGNMSWSSTAHLEAEMFVAACPKCTTTWVGANNSFASDLQMAETGLTLGAHIVSNGWSGTGLIVPTSTRRASSLSQGPPAQAMATPASPRHSQAPYQSAVRALEERLDHSDPSGAALEPVA